MEEILQQILNELAEAKQERLSMQQTIIKLTETVTALDKTVTENRQSQVLFEEHITKDINALKETQTLALESWQESIKIMQETKDLIDDKLSTNIAIEATLVNHETRITALEQAC